MKLLHGLLISLMLLLLAAGCTSLKPAEPLPPLAITEFTYQYNGMREGYTYTARAAEGGTELEISLIFGDFQETLLVQEPVLEKLGEIAGNYRLDRWDGFDKVDKRVLDGEGFTLYMTLEDGTRIEAHGSNAFPQGYQDAKSEITALFEELIGTYSSFYPKTLESDELNSVYILFTGENGNKAKKFKVIARTQDDGRICLDVEINGYENLLSEEAYYCNGYCEAFPFEEVQAIVRKYDIPSWNGWQRTAEDYAQKEWFELEFSYANDEYISAAGTLYPEQYDAVHSELLALCVAFVQENSHSFVPYTA